MATKPVQACVDNPKFTFESALASMRQGQVARKAPIVARKQPIAARPAAQASEKQALTDAARALAQLWKVSPHLVR